MFRKGSDTIVEQTYSVKSQYVDVVLADATQSFVRESSIVRAGC